jgi:hypothetical protein
LSMERRDVLPVTPTEEPLRTQFEELQYLADRHNVILKLLNEARDELGKLKVVEIPILEDKLAAARALNVEFLTVLKQHLEHFGTYDHEIYGEDMTKLKELTEALIARAEKEGK